MNDLLKKGGLQSAESYLEEGDQLLKENKISNASQVFSTLLQKSNLKAEAQALAGLVRCSLAEQNLDVAKQILQQIKEQFSNELSNPYVRKAIAAVELAEQASSSQSQSRDSLLAAITANPNDLQARYDLAISYFQTGTYEPALEQCFEIIKKDKTWQDAAARKLILKIFDALGPKDPITKNGKSNYLNNIFFKIISIVGKRRLSNLLF